MATHTFKVMSKLGGGQVGCFIVNLKPSCRPYKTQKGLKMNPDCVSEQVIFKDCTFRIPPEMHPIKSNLKCCFYEEMCVLLVLKLSATTKPKFSLISIKRSEF